MLSIGKGATKYLKFKRPATDINHSCTVERTLQEGSAGRDIRCSIWKIYPADNDDKSTGTEVP